MSWQLVLNILTACFAMRVFGVNKCELCLSCVFSPGLTKHEVKPFKRPLCKKILKTVRFYRKKLTCLVKRYFSIDTGDLKFESITVWVTIEISFWRNFDQF